jgi:pimeloyl-ACP methyl ester carboxylesterase
MTANKPVRGPGLLPRLAAAARLPLWHEAQAYAQRRAIEQCDVWRSPSLDAAGLPVLLVGGMGSTPAMLGPLRDLLERLNCRVAVAPVRFGIACGEVTTRAVEEALAGLAEAAAAPVMVIGHSRGGQFARTVAVRRPDLVGGLVTLGAPLTRMLPVHPVLLASVVALGAAGALGVSGVLRPSCRWGLCCARLRADLVGAFPDAVPFLSVYSRTDRIVDWRSSRDPAARHHEIDVSHGGLIWDPASLIVIVEELARICSSALESVAPASEGVIRGTR